MISQITIKNIALIDELTIHFDEGFNVLTGETGAGKSIIIDSVNLALGERADRDLIQTGKDYARVELLFHLPSHDKINELLQAYGLEAEPDGSLLLMRELTIQGKNNCRINGRTVTLSMLREISSLLVDIHGQHQHQSLLSPESHITFLDRIGGEELGLLKSQLKNTYDAWQRLKKEIRTILGLNKDGVRRMDILQYQINEIEEAKLLSGEEEALRKERAILINAEKIVNVVNEAYQELYSGKNGALSISDSIARLAGQFQSISNIDDSLDSLASQMEGIQYTMEDLILQLRSYKEAFEYDPYRLEEIENRLELILNIKRKYGSSIEDVLVFKQELENELFLLENSQEKLEDLSRQEKVLFQDIVNQCYNISRIRKQCSKTLEQGLMAQLADLNMAATKFEVRIDSPDSTGEIEPSEVTQSGYDIVEFLISPNPGEPLKPLAKIISGGEMSRVMLAFKTIMGELDEIPTMIFDEIDVGISGRTAQRVAEKIGGISQTHQIICVTHLPQIAAMGDCHFIIEKVSTDNHTETRVSKLDYGQRQREVARMIGGTSITPISLEHAEELIGNADNYKIKSILA